MPNPRGRLMCGPVRGADGAVQRVVAAGGQGEGHGAFAIVEVYDVAADTWSTGSPLPFALNRGAVVDHGNTFLVIGGFTMQGTSAMKSDKIMKFTSDGTWEVLNDRLSADGFAPVAINIGPGLRKCDNCGCST